MSATSATRRGPEEGFLLIADISGYTGYLANNELEHAQGILAEFTDLLIRQLSAPFQFVELEGDAVFVYAPKPLVEDSERLLEIVEICYASFRLLQEQMVTNSNCTCKACRAIGDLDLKCVGHFGRYVAQQSPHGLKPVGADVITVHRLLKNSVIKNTDIEAYAFLTEAFVDQARFASSGLGGTAHCESYDELGEIRGHVFDLRTAIERHNGTKRVYVSSDEADLIVATDFPVPASVLWAYHIDAGRRARWQQDIVDIDNQANADGRMEAGGLSYCDHGNYRLNHRIADWRPFEYLTMDTESVGDSLAKPPSGLATFEFEALEGQSCRVHMRMQMRNRGFVTRLFVVLLGWAVKRQLRSYYRRLDEIIRSEDLPLLQA